MRASAILETVLYAADLAAARTFYRDVMGLTLYAELPGRQIFFKLDRQMLLIFDPGATEVAPQPGGLPVPPHGARGPGHVCFTATAAEIDAWRRHLETNGIVIEADFHWPSKNVEQRGRSIYFRDPAGNSVEIAEERIWGYGLAGGKKVLEKGMRLVVASHNQGKVREFGDLLRPFGLDVVSAGELGLPEPEETETTFVGNARLKALAAARLAKLPALSDDSGLEVEALGGAPGIYSARWAGASKDFTVAMQRVHDELAAKGAWGGSGPGANFTAALCLAWPDGDSETFEGKVFGRLVWPPRGRRGFGYDPMFLPDGGTETFGEMEPDAKHAISHRARAFTLLKGWLGPL